MKDIYRVNSLQLYEYCKKLAIGLLTIIAMMLLSRALPYYLAPLVSALTTAVLYAMLYTGRREEEGSCTLTLYALFRCVMNYTVVLIVLNIVQLWDKFSIPDELNFFNDPFISALLFFPVSVVTLVWVYIRRKHLAVCEHCKLQAGGLYERGKIGSIFRYESYFQLRNLLYVFTLLSVIVWSYYLLIYVNITVNSRDWYVFIWFSVIAFILDEIYFVYRYYNLYLDLKENNEIISQNELNDMTAKTYLRFYVICGNKMYVDPHSIDPSEQYREVLDTPFQTKRSVTGLSVSEVKSIITRLTGVKDGELRFFYGRRVSSTRNASILRYFYFLDGDVDQYQDIPVDGKWLDFSEIKKIYVRTPGNMAPIGVADITRMATVILTQKIFDENGRRKLRLKSYKPSFNLEDVRKSDTDFQDDKWIKISLFNSDCRFFELRRLWRNLRSRRSRSLPSAGDPYSS